MPAFLQLAEVFPLPAAAGRGNSCEPACHLGKDRQVHQPPDALACRGKQVHRRGTIGNQRSPPPKESLAFQRALERAGAGLVLG